MDQDSIFTDEKIAEYELTYYTNGNTTKMYTKKYRSKELYYYVTD